MRGQNKNSVRRNDEEGGAGYPTLDEIENDNDLSSYCWKLESTLTLGQHSMSESELRSSLSGDQDRSKVRSRLVSIIVKLVKIDIQTKEYNLNYLLKYSKSVCFICMSCT